MIQKEILKKIPVTLVLVIMLSSAFSHVNTFSNTATAPFISDNKADGTIAEPIESSSPLVGMSTCAAASEISAADDILDIQDTSGAAEVPPEMIVPDGYALVRMEASDISRGSLILVNYSNNYEIPELDDNIAISSIKSSSYRVTDTEMQLSSSIMGPLNDMMDAFFAEIGLSTVTIRSAFRDYEAQQRIYNEYVGYVGSAEANRWAALPGYSEHHTGLAFDFGIYSESEIRTFTNTGEFIWFAQNSWKYGFIPRYPSEKTDITGVVYEPWHYRFVGEPHAYIMARNDWCLEEYLETIMRHTHEEPYIIVYNDNMYEIYYTGDSAIYVPDDCAYEISGNNTDGFIVTLMRSGGLRLQ